VSVELADFVTLIDRGGVLVLLSIMVIGGMKGWYVWRHEVDKAETAFRERIAQVERDRDWWRDVAVRSLRIGEAAVGQTIEQQRRDLQGQRRP
jgi:hypothetical protein